MWQLCPSNAKRCVLYGVSGCTKEGASQAVVMPIHCSQPSPPQPSLHSDCRRERCPRDTFYICLEIAFGYHVFVFSGTSRENKSIPVITCCWKQHRGALCVFTYVCSAGQIHPGRGDYNTKVYPFGIFRASRRCPSNPPRSGILNIMGTPCYISRNPCSAGPIHGDDGIFTQGLEVGVRVGP